LNAIEFDALIPAFNKAWQAADARKMELHGKIQSASPTTVDLTGETSLFSLLEREKLRAPEELSLNSRGTPVQSSGGKGGCA